MNGISKPDSKAKAKTLVNTNYAQSALISGIQWDVTMAFINGKKDGNGNNYDVTVASNSRHTGKLEKCGNNLADKVCNIYDLEGNQWEYIAEKHTDDSYGHVYRGGRHGSAFATCAAQRMTALPKDPAYPATFRMVLYVL